MRSDGGSDPHCGYVPTYSSSTKITVDSLADVELYINVGTLYETKDHWCTSLDFHGTRFP
jgi:hypothetical protein